MIEKKKKNWIPARIWACAALLFTLIVQTVDVANIGPEGTSVGLSHLNGSIHNALGVNIGWYDITVWLGIVSLAVVALFAGIGFIQLVRRKNLFKVDVKILILGCLYIVTGALYLFFGKVAVNYRPIIMPGEISPQASFPSSHTMLVCVVFGSLIALCKTGKSHSRINQGIIIGSGIIIALMVIGRLISGVHWFTDIVAGVLYSITLVTIYRTLIRE